ncbi:hypothetical protein Lfu02_41170 [Longispora fulva]|uniref:Uncharacterized protein n=1 Tax=Longispora fulva TaxID=619741 RepID=A0A8J7GT05_9ACTN|nr:hypothetical protein [Longispora fulva]MBG6136576.1 hypothetical protein [Longispora fulva]GIG59745.1 hypothetical protein Lfu02_41170 [Longispora fulva]
MLTAPVLCAPQVTEILGDPRAAASSVTKGAVWSWTQGPGNAEVLVDQLVLGFPGGEAPRVFDQIRRAPLCPQRPPLAKVDTVTGIQRVVRGFKDTDIICVQVATRHTCQAWLQRGPVVIILHASGENPVATESSLAYLISMAGRRLETVIP